MSRTPSHTANVLQLADYKMRRDKEYLEALEAACMNFDSEERSRMMHPSNMRSSYHLTLVSSRKPRLRLISLTKSEEEASDR